MMVSTCSWAAEEKKPPVPDPTQKELLLAKQATLVARKQKLDAQFQLVQAQFVLTQQELSAVNAELEKLAKLEKEESKGKNNDGEKKK
jgi:hypothetical protein